jgi:hypothetical protein
VAVQVYDGDGVEPLPASFAPWAPAVVAREELHARGEGGAIELLDRWNRLMRPEAVSLCGSLLHAAERLPESVRKYKVLEMAQIVAGVHKINLSL